MTRERLAEPATTTPAVSRSAAGSLGRAVRRVILLVILVSLTVLAANGVGDLLGRAIDRNLLLASSDTAGLAASLAFALIGGPLAGIAWWVIWRGMGESAERSSTAWGLAVLVLSTIALVTASNSLLSTIASAVGGDWKPYALANGAVWAAIWLLYRWVSGHPTKGPLKLRGSTVVLGTVYGIVIGVGGAITALGILFDAAIGSLSVIATVGEPWWVGGLRAVVWLLGGALVWWWFDDHDRGRELRSTLALVVQVVLAGVVGVALALGGLATAIFVALRLVFEPSLAPTVILAPLAEAAALAVVGAVLWRGSYSRVRVMGATALLGTRLVTSGVTLAAASTGIGIVVNSALAAIVAPLVETSGRSLLFAGLSVLLVGAPAWWAVWRPTAAVPPELARDTGRRVYLIIVFGASAIVAIVTLLVIGYRIFSFTLDTGVGASLLDQVRAPLGLLIATTLAAGYHFAVWRGDRARVATLEPPSGAARRLGEVVLVAGSDLDRTANEIRDITGARVTRWQRSDGVGGAPSRAELVAALETAEADRVLVLVNEATVEVIPLAR